MEADLSTQQKLSEFCSEFPENEPERRSGAFPSNSNPDLLTLKRVYRSPGSWASMVPNIGFRGLSVLDLGRGTGRTDRRTDDGDQRLMPLHTEVGGIISNRRRPIGTQVVSVAEVTFKRHSRSPAMSPFDTS